MPITTFQVALWVELLAAGLGGLQGALFAADARDRRIDVLGVLVIGLIVALGGSLLRDVVLNQPPVVIWMNEYVIVAGVAALVGMFIQPLITHVNWLIVVLDAVVMGLFGAIGGGMLRDIVLSWPVSFLQVGTLYAVAAGSGVGALVLLIEIGTPILIAALVCIGVTTAVRLSAVVFGWRFPEQRALSLPRVRTRGRS